jgi:hypothetical protein
MNDKPKDFMDPAQLVEDSCCPFSKRALYWHIWRAGINGLAPAIYRVGRKIIISRSGFIEWLTSHQRKSRSGENE